MIIDARLPLHPFAQANFERPMRARRERTKGQGIPGPGPCGPGPGHEDVRLLIAHHNDGGVQSKLDLRVAGKGLRGDRALAPSLGHNYAACRAGREKTCASSASWPRPICSTAALMRPLRDKTLSASATRRRLG